MKKFLKWLVSTTPKSQNPLKAGVFVGCLIVIGGLFLAAITLNPKYLHCLWFGPVCALVLPPLG